MSATLDAQGELKSLCKALTEAQDTGSKTDQTDLLNKLLAVRVDERLLRTTGAGQVVGRLRNSGDAAIATLAKRVVHKWKKDVMAANPRTGGPAAGASPASRSQTPRSAGHATPQHQQPRAGADSQQGRAGAGAGVGPRPPTGESTATPGGAPTPGSADNSAPGTPLSPSGNGSAPRTAALDGAHVAKTGDSVRDKCVELLYNSMAADSVADADLLARRALDIERIEFEKAKATSPAYRTRIRSLCSNLRDKKNPELRLNVVEGAISAKRFCSMTSEEMASKELRDTIEKMKEENLFKAQGAGREEAVTDQFKCGRCKQRKCSYYQLQTRSADEPMTTFVTCAVCNNRWKFC
ncbi:transcription elongation factor TFIIS [Coemansia biformis]|uniref:Transcription elongation factor n=1 Tax=Coemansia biformis TaxID=1286918 RepID=A0A9W8D0D7_9FUNG|nr:transcription elongation factor TFIIS [Coemansia biformis]